VTVFATRQLLILNGPYGHIVNNYFYQPANS